jgi:hypothetical protein
MTVALTVTDGQSTDTQHVLVKVIPRRGWETSVDEAQATSDAPLGELVKPLPGEAPVDLVLGKNVCAYDGAPSHALHAPAASPVRSPSGGLWSSWLGDGFTVTPVQDPGGPFDNWWYLGSSNLRIKRAAYINKELGGSAPDFPLVREAVKAHELEHGLIIFAKMVRIKSLKRDPATIIEVISAPTRDKAVEIANDAIRQVESYLLPGQGEANYIAVHEEIKSRLVGRNRRWDRPATIQIRNGPHRIPNLARSGENEGR